MADKVKKKWVRWVIIGVAILVIGAVAFTAYTRSAKEAEARIASAKNVQAQKGDISVVVQASGSLNPSESTTVYAPVMADVGEITIKNGDTVKKGDVIFLLINNTIDDEIASLQANLTTQDSQLRMANKSKSSKISSPVSGRVKAVYVSAGQEAASAMQTQNGLILLSSDDKMEIRFVPVSAVAPGDPVTVSIGANEVEATIKTYINGEASILVKDDSYEVGAAAKVALTDKTPLGEGLLTVHMPYYVSGSEGVVSEISVDINDNVNTGDTLIKLEEPVYSTTYLQLLTSRQNTLDQLSEKLAQKEQLTVRAPQEGVIENLSASQGTTVPEGTRLFSIGSTNAFDLVIAVDELDIANVLVGQTVNIALDALAGATYTGKVTRISGTGNYVNGMTTYNVTILVDQSARILSGMSARADILVASREDVLLIPVSAIKTIDEEKYVIVMPAAGSNVTSAEWEGVQTKITVGLFNSSQAEVLSGIQEGQYVQDLSVSADSSGFPGFGSRTSGM